MARQPILDAAGDLFGYELLFRDMGEAEAVFENGNIATARVLTHSLIDIGLDTLTGDRPAFVNMPEDFLSGELTVPLDPRQVVLEVMENVDASPEVLNGIAQMRETGFRVCLSHSATNTTLYDLLDYADMVKIDVLDADPKALRAEVENLRERQITCLIASRVETHVMQKLCEELGFDYFQGFYFAEPEIVHGKQIPSNELTLLQLMSKSWQPDVDLGEIEDLITQDVSLSYKLLRFINSAAFVTRREIDTIHGAVVVLGIRHLARWISMLTVSSLDQSGTALTELALVRGRMCELVALARGEKHDAPTYFTAGLLSTLDALLGMPMAETLDLLPLSDDLNNALLAREGPVGETLASVIAYEQGQWGNAEAQLLTDAYLDAVSWTRQMQASISAM